MARARPRVPLGCRARPAPPRPASASAVRRGASRRPATRDVRLRAMAGRDLGPRLPTCLSSLAGADFGFVRPLVSAVCGHTHPGRRAD